MTHTQFRVVDDERWDTSHKHTRDRVEGPFAKMGMCECPGCHNAFGQYVERCKCGARRVVCSGMGAASLMKHVANGHCRWERDSETHI
jgi:hypothetical protein